MDNHTTITSSSAASSSSSTNFSTIIATNATNITATVSYQPRSYEVPINICIGIVSILIFLYVLFYLITLVLLLLNSKLVLDDDMDETQFYTNPDDNHNRNSGSAAAVAAGRSSGHNNNNNSSSNGRVSSSSNSGGGNSRSDSTNNGSLRRTMARNQNSFSQRRRRRNSLLVKQQQQSSSARRSPHRRTSSYYNNAQNNNDNANHSFNLYLFFLSLPDCINTLVTAYLLFNNAVNDTQGNIFICKLQRIMGYFYYMINLYLNAIIAYEIQTLVIHCYNRRRVPPPSLRRVCYQVVVVYVATSLYITWAVTDTDYSLFTRDYKTCKIVQTGSKYMPSIVSSLIAFTIFWPPIIYVCYVGLYIYRKKLLPIRGRTRAVSIYFFRIVGTFVCIYIPLNVVAALGLSQQSVSSTSYFLSLFTYVLALIQCPITVLLASTKDDIYNALYNLSTRLIDYAFDKLCCCWFGSCCCCHTETPVPSGTSDSMSNSSITNNHANPNPRIGTNHHPSSSCTGGGGGGGGSSTSTNHYRRQRQRSNDNNHSMWNESDVYEDMPNLTSITHETSSNMNHGVVSTMKDDDENDHDHGGGGGEISSPSVVRMNHNTNQDENKDVNDDGRNNNNNNKMEVSIVMVDDDEDEDRINRETDATKDDDNYDVNSGVVDDDNDNDVRIVMEYDDTIIHKGVDEDDEDISHSHKSQTSNDKNEINGDHIVVDAADDGNNNDNNNNTKEPNNDDDGSEICIVFVKEEDDDEHEIGLQEKERNKCTY